MLRTLKRLGQPGRLRSTLIGLFVLGGSLTLLALLNVPLSAQSKDKDTSKAKDDKAQKDEAPKWPEYPKLTLVGKSDKEEDVTRLTEMVSTINKMTVDKWKENEIVPSEFADDYMFLRRVTLDIIGRIAKSDEIREYMKDSKETRRSKLVNRLLDSDEYPRRWADLWGNWLLSRSGMFGRGPYHDFFVTWLEDQFASNVAYPKLVKSLIAAKGDNTDTAGGAASNFILAHVGENVPNGQRKDDGHFQMVPLTSRITRLFLGTQVQCAQCHDHPFYSNIKQEHFWGVNAFLRQVERGGQPPRMGRMMTYNKLTLSDDEGVVQTPLVFFEKRNGVVLTAKAEFLPADPEAKHGARLPAKTTGIGRREALADFIIEHPQFPKAIVNRMWGVFFGRGFVNPVDDFNDQNQPSNPELLEELASRFKNYDYDFKKLIRWICNSTPYNLSYVANKTNDKPEHEPLFSRMVMKAMAPEQLFESLVTAAKMEAAETKDGKKNLKKQWLGSLITSFGDDEGNEVNFNGTVVQALMMMNGSDINDAITRKNGVVDSVVKSKTEVAAINDLFLTVLNRPPTNVEIRRIYQQFRLRPKFARDDYKWPTRRYQDLFWALLNSNEFLLNH